MWEVHIGNKFVFPHGTETFSFNPSDAHAEGFQLEEPFVHAGFWKKRIYSGFTLLQLLKRNAPSAFSEVAHFNKPRRAESEESE